MSHLEKVIQKRLPYSETRPGEDMEPGEVWLDVYDISGDFPFRIIELNRVDKWDVCRTETCIEYGNEIRNDQIEARNCTLDAAIAVLQMLHLKHYPAKRRAYINRRLIVTDSILD